MMGKKGKAESVSSGDLKFTVNLVIDEKQLTIDIDEKLRIPSVDVLTPQKACNMMAENPALHARWNVLANKSAFEADYEKMKFEVWVKEKSKTYRSELAEVAGKRVTDKMVDEAVTSDPEYLRGYRRYLEKRENAANLKSIAIGFGERGERLVNITSMMKNERPTAGVRRSRDRDEDDVAAFTSSESSDDDDDDDEK
jgi:hypothetical protein